MAVFWFLWPQTKRRSSFPIFVSNGSNKTRSCEIDFLGGTRVQFTMNDPYEVKEYITFDQKGPNLFYNFIDVPETLLNGPITSAQWTNKFPRQTPTTQYQLYTDTELMSTTSFRYDTIGNNLSTRVYNMTTSRNITIEEYRLGSLSNLISMLTLFYNPDEYYRIEIYWYQNDFIVYCPPYFILTESKSIDSVNNIISYHRSWSCHGKEVLRLDYQTPTNFTNNFYSIST